MIEYWHWHTNHFGTETYWVGILPARPAARPGLRASSAGSGADLPARRVPGGRSAARRPGRAALLGPLEVGIGLPGRVSRSPGRRPARRSPTWTNGRTTESSKPSTGAPSKLGVPARILHDNQIIGADGAPTLDPATVAEELPVLIVPGLLVADDAMLIWLRDYAAAGGHLVIGPRTAYGDEEGRARVEVKPARLADAAGVRYQEFSNLGDPLPVIAASDGITLSDSGRGHRLGGRLDQRRRQGGPRVRPPALRPVPGRGDDRATAAAGSPRSAPCPILPSPPTSPAGWFSSRTGSGGTCRRR